MAAGVFYGIMNYFSGKGYLPGCSFAELRPQIAVPMLMGFLYGPWGGFVTGCLGDSLGYVFAGFGPLHAWNWSIGNGFIGMTPGFLGLARTGRKIASVRDFQFMLLLIVLASSLPILFSIVTDRFRVGPASFHEAMYTLFFPIFITDAVLGVIMVPAFLLLARRLAVTIETRTMLMVTYLLVLTVLGTYAASVLATWSSGHPDVLLIRDLYSIGIIALLVLIAGLWVAAFFSRRITAPVVILTDAANAISRGDYLVVERLDPVARREDELGHLAKVFQHMVRDVATREQTLKNEVRELKIEIDKSKQRRDVDRITNSEYFQRLRQRASTLRLATPDRPPDHAQATQRGSKSGD